MAAKTHHPRKALVPVKRIPGALAAKTHKLAPHARKIANIQDVARTNRIRDSKFRGEIGEACESFINYFEGLGDSDDFRERKAWTSSSARVRKAPTGNCATQAEAAA